MEDPVIAEDGHTYERVAIVAWVEGHGTSPITRDPLDKNILITNRVLKSQIEQYREKKSGGEKPKKKVKKPKKKDNKRSKVSSRSLPASVERIYSRKRIIDDKEKVITYITISGFSYSIFRYVLEFIYTGVLNGVTKDKLPYSELLGAGSTFGLEFLIQLCNNLSQGDEVLNPSIGTYLNDETSKNILETYFNKSLYSDFKFDIEGREINSHKLIVGNFCEVLKRMISNNSFIEGKSGVVHIEDTSFIAFKAFLEYIYTAHCPIQESEDSVGILMLAHQFNITRLITLCELYISKQIEIATTNGIEKAEIDIIGLLLLSQQYNANQLEKFLLHFISNNYGPMSKRPEWEQIEGENRDYIEAHRWPPLSYLQDLETYESAMKNKDEKCIVM